MQFHISEVRLGKDFLGFYADRSLAQREKRETRKASAEILFQTLCAMDVPCYDAWCISLYHHLLHNLRRAKVGWSVMQNHFLPFSFPLPQISVRLFRFFLGHTKQLFCPTDQQKCHSLCNLAFIGPKWTIQTDKLRIWTTVEKVSPYFI